MLDRRGEKKEWSVVIRPPPFSRHFFRPLGGVFHSGGRGGEGRGGITQHYAAGKNGGRERPQFWGGMH